MHGYGGHKDGGMALVWKKRVTDLLSVKAIVGFDTSHRLFAISKNTMQFAKNSFE